MLLHELKCLEILMRQLVYNTDLQKEIHSELPSLTDFDTKKNNLFNIISINNLIANYNTRSPFSLEEFLKTGKIPGIYEEETLVPTIEPKYYNRLKQFYKDLIKALKDEEYVFDENNNIYVASEDIEVVIPQIWLYRLSEGFKRKKYERVYFYNKNKETTITDKDSLINYIQHTKTFLVTLSSPKNDNYESTFNLATKLTNDELKTKEEIKVDDIIEIFKDNISNDYKVNISKYKLKDLFWLVNKAEAMGLDFYTLTFKEQQDTINNWIIEFINSNDRTIMIAEEYILLTNSYKQELYNFNKQDILIGLCNIYLKIISKYDIDYDNISLSNLKIDSYLSNTLIKYQIDQKNSIKKINNLKDEIKNIQTLTNKQNIEVKKLDLIKDKNKIPKYRENFMEMASDYSKLQLTLDKEMKELKGLENYIRYENETSITDLIFDNNEKMSLISSVLDNGRIYINQHGTRIIFEKYDEYLGKTIFKASINIKDLITLIEDINYNIQEEYKLR